MGQSTPIKANDEEEASALTWARLAGLVEFCPEGSWRLTQLGRSRVAEMLVSAHAFGDATMAPSRGRTRQLI